MKNHPTIGLDSLVAGRLTFEYNGRTYVYDSRGYEFARQTDVIPLFGAYDDGWPHHFAFYEADCFDPPQYLICARTFEDEYDIFLDEFGTEVDTTDSDFNTPEKCEESMNNGAITYTGGGKLVHCENEQGHELKLVNIENISAA